MKMIEREKEKHKFLKAISEKVDSIPPKYKFAIVLLITAVVFYARYKSGKLGTWF